MAEKQRANQGQIKRLAQGSRYLEEDHQELNRSESHKAFPTIKTSATDLQPKEEMIGAKSKRELFASLKPASSVSTPALEETPHAKFVNRSQTLREYSNRVKT